MTPTEGSASGRFPVGLEPTDEWIRSLGAPFRCCGQPREPPRAGRSRWACDAGHGVATPRLFGGAQLAPMPHYQANSGSGGALAGALAGAVLGSSRWPSDPAHDGPVGDHGDQPARTAAIGTRENVDGEHSVAVSSAQRSRRVLAGFESAAWKSGEPEPELTALHSVEPWCDSARARGPGTMRSGSPSRRR